MRDTGYIYNVQPAEGGGRILVCEGGFKGLRVGFFIADCSPQLQATLAAAGTISLPQQCPAPAGAIQVSFGYKTWSNGAVQATLACDVTSP
jgi:hypothetical protein